MSDYLIRRTMSSVGGGPEAYRRLDGSWTGSRRLAARHTKADATRIVDSYPKWVGTHFAAIRMA